jgi:hypothetical protein
VLEGRGDEPRGRAERVGHQLRARFGWMAVGDLQQADPVGPIAAHSSASKVGTSADVERAYPLVARAHRHRQARPRRGDQRRSSHGSGRSPAVVCAPRRRRVVEPSSHLARPCTGIASCWPIERAHRATVSPPATFRRIRSSDEVWACGIHQGGRRNGGEYIPTASGFALWMASHWTRKGAHLTNGGRRDSATVELARNAPTSSV